MNLKEQVVYKLPNGRELIARVTTGDKTLLCSLNASDEIRYEVSNEGRLFAYGRLTAWSTEDLSDTARMLSPEDSAQVFARIA